MDLLKTGAELFRLVKGECENTQVKRSIGSNNCIAKLSQSP